MCSKDVKMSKIRYGILPSGMQRFMQEDKRREEDKPLCLPIKLCVRVLVHIRNTRMLIYFFALRVCVCVYMHIYIFFKKMVRMFESMCSSDSFYIVLRAT